MHPNCTVFAFTFKRHGEPMNSAWRRLKGILAFAAIVLIAVPIAIVLFAVALLGSAAMAVMVALRRDDRSRRAPPPDVIEGEYTVIEDRDRDRGSGPQGG